MPEAFELLALADDGVCKVQPYPRVKLRSEFREDTFQTFFFNARRFQITFLFRRSVNGSVESIEVVRVTQHVGSRVNYTPNMFIYSWGVNPTDTIPPNVYNITWHAYDPICTFHGLVLRCNNERLRLKRIDLKRIHSEELLARIRVYVRDDVVENVFLPLITPWVMPCPMILTAMTDGSTLTTPNDKLRAL